MSRRDGLRGQAVILALLALSLHACGRGVDGARVGTATGPTLRLLAAVQLSTSDSVSLSEYLRLLVTPDGHMFVADGPAGTVLQYSPRGAYLRRFGGKGRGPGELQGPHSMHIFAADSLLLVNDYLQHKAVLFDLRTGKWQRDVPSLAQELGSQWTTSGDTVLVGSSYTRGLLAYWSPEADTIRVGLSAPEWIWARRIPAMRYGRTEAVVGGDSVLLAIAGVEGVAVARRAASDLEVRTFPAVRRRSVPRNMREAVQQRRADNDLSPVGASVAGLARLQGGEVAVVHLDLEQLRPREGGPEDVRRMPSFGNYRLWVSVLQADLQRACVDGQVPIQSINYPAVMFTGDTLRVLTQSLAGDAVETKISSFRIGTESCRWYPIVVESRKP